MTHARPTSALVKAGAVKSAPVLAPGLAVLGLAALALAGCATADTARLAEEPNYQVGYGDGCTTGMEEGKSFSTKRVRDPYLFENDQAYRAGWRQGYLQCGRRDSDPSDGGRILGEDDRF